MTVPQAVILAVMQGVTEFMPISSSGHLVLTRALIGITDIPLLFDLILHLGTVTATVIIYRKTIADILRDVGVWLLYRRGERTKGSIQLFLYIIISTAITGIIGLLFKERIKSVFINPVAVSALLIVTGFILLATRFVGEKDGGIESARIHVPVVIGLAQSMAMLPGISRSGSTISAGLFLGLRRDLCGTYSFLLSIPSVFGASVLEYARSHSQLYMQVGLPLVITAFVFSFISGYWSLRLLLRFLERGRLWIFSFYCIVAGVLGLILQ
ncbi:MAG: undecaprenyl-diphosphate phosphatase [Spirochaetes bacterium]|nr:undecaprenyl-diphosphate phosphatase [Spirochaetota bacterium]